MAANPSIQDRKVNMPGKKEAEDKADKARKAKVDKANTEAAAKAKSEQDKLASTPLTTEERAFITRIAPLMNEGRKIMQPSAADILRYSKLIKRKDV